MTKNKKLISIVAAIAMIVTMFSSFTMASAVSADEITSGITLTYDSATTNNDGTQSIKVLVGYKGITGGVSSFAVRFNDLPASITDLTGVSKAGGMASPVTDELTTSHWASFGAAGTSATTDDGELAELTFVSSKELSVQAVLKLAEGTSYVYDNSSVRHEVGEGEGKIPVASTVLAVDSAKETTDVERGAVDTSTDTTPVLDPIVTVDEGITLTAGELTEVGDGTYTYDVTVGYKGITGGVSSFAVRFNNLPASVTDLTGVSKAGGMASPVTDELTTSHWASFGAAGTSATTDDGELAVLTFKLNEKPTNDIQLTLATGTSYVYDNSSARHEVGEGEGKIPAANVNLVAPKAEEKTGKEVAMPLDSDKVVDETVGTTGESDYYIVADVVDADGNKVAYGAETYKAEIVYEDANGDEQKIPLTEGQYKNLINGHLGADNLANVVAAANIKNMADVVDKLKYVVYNDGLKVKAQLVQATADGNLIQDEGEGSAKGGGSSEPKYTKPTLSVKASKTSTTVGSGDTITVTATYDFKDYANNATVAISAVDDTLDLATSSGFKIEYEQAEEDPLELVTKIEDEVTLIDNIAEKGTIKITYKPGSVGTAKFTFAITGQNEAGTVLDKPVTGTASTKINKASTSGSGSGSSSKDSDNKSSGGGAIATGLVDSGSGYIPSLGFDDLGDVEWAQNAINTLAAKKIVSGVGDNKFDPNAALTRAAYAQMLVNAIGHSQDSADVEFDDVPTDAWFYHNVAVAAQLGIVAGFGDGTFRPYDLITREQMALMTQKAAVVMGKSLIGADNGTFTDDADIADWAHDAVYTLSNAGIISGMGDGTFAPQANATRAQAAVIIYQAFVK